MYQKRHKQSNLYNQRVQLSPHTKLEMKLRFFFFSWQRNCTIISITSEDWWEIVIFNIPNQNSSPTWREVLVTLAKFYQLAQDNSRKPIFRAHLWKKSHNSQNKKSHNFIRTYNIDKGKDCYLPELGKALSKCISTHTSWIFQVKSSLLKNIIFYFRITDLSPE